MRKQYFLHGLFLSTTALMLVLPGSLQAQSSSPAAQKTSQQAATGQGSFEFKGTVVDDHNKPLYPVHITNRAGDFLGLTDESGAFNIQTQLLETLYFKYPGYDQLVHVVKQKNVTAIRMHVRFLPAGALTDGSSAGLPDSEAANGVATAKDTATEKLELPPSNSAGDGNIQVLYSTQPGYSMLGSAATVTHNELSYTAAPQYTYALPGRLAGLNIIQNQGFYMPALTGQTDRDFFVGNIPTNKSGVGPTDNNQFNIQLRGHNASLGQSPLVIIDGIQREIYSLDPDQIASVTVLKDALSNIMLGQNSSRGALVVTTLQPKLGAPRLSFSAQTGIQSSLKMPKPLSSEKYAYLLNEALLNDGKKPAYSAADFAAYANGSDPYGHPDVNWYDALLQKNPLIKRYDLNVTGGNKIARYMVDLGYLDQDGIFKNSSANTYNTNLSQKRYSLNSKIDFNINKDFDLGLNIIGRLENNNQPGTGTLDVLTNLMNTPNNAYPIFNPDGSYGGNASFSNNLLAQVQDAGYLTQQERDIMVNLDMKYKLDNWVKGWWVKLNGNVSVQSASYIDRSKQGPVFEMNVSDAKDTTYARFGTTINQNNAFTATSWARYWYAQASTGYDKQIGEHQIGAVLLYDQKQTLLNFDLPSVMTNYAFKGNYNYGRKYFAEGGLDYGGYSRYQTGHRYGLFYAGGLGWDIAKEHFISEGAKWINQLKLRGTYGKTGNANVDNYGYYIWNSHFENVNVSYPIGSAYPGPIGMQEGQTLANVNATWEKAKKLDLGLDISLFDHHFQANFDYYHERYSDIMQSRGKSIVLIGSGYPAENIGIALYHGAELSMTYQNAVKNFNYYITGNASLQYSKVLYMDEQQQPNSWNVHTGLPVGQRFGLQADGFIENAQEAATAPTITGYTLRVGDVKYKDLNNDGVIDQFDATALGRTGPIVYYGLSAGFSYKGLEVNFLIQGVQNRDIYVDNLTTEAGFQGLGNSFGQAYQQIQNRWTPETASTAVYPLLSAGFNAYNYNPNYMSTSLFLHNGNYLRLKNVGVAYTLPYQWTQKLKVGSIKVFVNALNLWTWAAYDAVDPEISMPNYPMQSVINTGINIKL